MSLPFPLTLFYICCPTSKPSHYTVEVAAALGHVKRVSVGLGSFQTMNFEARGIQQSGTQEAHTHTRLCLSP